MNGLIIIPLAFLPGVHFFSLLIIRDLRRFTISEKGLEMIF